MVPFQNFTVLLFSFLSFYFLLFRRSRGLIWAFLFAFLAVYSNGNGMLCLGISLVILLFNKRYKLAALWTLFSMLTVLLYFWGYEKPAWVGEGTLKNRSVLDKLLFGFEFIGSYMGILFDHTYTLSVSRIKSLISSFFGLGVLSFFIYSVHLKYPFGLKSSFEKLRQNKPDQFWLTVLIFFGATTIAIALNRTGFKLFSRYTLNASLILSAVYLFSLSAFNWKKIPSLSFLIFTAGMASLSYFNYWSIALEQKNNSKTDAYNWLHTGSWAVAYSDSSHVKRVNPLLKEIYERGAYVFPEMNPRDFRETIKNEKLELPFTLEAKLSFDSKYLVLSGVNPAQQELKIALVSEEKTFVFPVNYFRNNPWEYLRDRSYYSTRFNAYVAMMLLPQSRFKLYLLEKTQQGFKAYFLNQEVTKYSLFN
jgi:hypothetical protein